MRRLATDQRGLSTLEYAVLFVLLIVGLLAVWQKLRTSLGSQLDHGVATFSDTLTSANARGAIAPGSETAAQGPAVASPFAPAQVRPRPANELSSPGHANGTSSPALPATPPPSASAALAATAATGPAAQPTASTSPAVTPTPPPTPGFWDNTLTTIRESAVGQGVLGLGYGLQKAFTPGGFLAPSPSDKPAFQAGMGVGEMAGGVLQIVGGDAITGAGVGIAGAGLAAEGPSFGTSTVAVVGGAAVATTGVAISTHGAATVAAGANQLIHVVRGSQEPPKTGETPSTKTGKEVHGDRAAVRRKSGEWDEVNTHVKDANGEPIEVAKRVDPKTGEPVGDRTQRVQPDAVSYKRGEILDDKPAGRPISKDRQEIIRFINAYKEKTGKLPDRIIIERYNPANGAPAGREVYVPKDFLP